MNSDAASFRRLENVERRGDRIELSKRTRIEGAHRCTFVDCEFDLLPRGVPAARFGERFEFGFCRFVGCRFVTRSRVLRLDLTARCVLDSCEFVGGPFEELTVGHTSDTVDILDGWCSTSVKNCDFRNAVLRDARIFQTPPSELRLPGWPHISVIRPWPALPNLDDEPRIPGSLTVAPNEDRLNFSLEFIRGEVVRQGSPGNLTARVLHAEQLCPNDDDRRALRAELDRVKHPRILY